eukprot:743522-Prorocentrum_minimum.AAC.8
MFGVLGVPLVPKVIAEKQREIDGCASDCCVLCAEIPPALHDERNEKGQNECDLRECSAVHRQ